MMVGRNIRHYRQKRGLTEKEIGEALGHAPREIAAIEAGQVRISAASLYDLAILLQCNLSNFFAIEPDAP